MKSITSTKEYQKYQKHQKYQKYQKYLNYASRDRSQEKFLLCYIITEP